MISNHGSLAIAAICTTLLLATPARTHAQEDELFSLVIPGRIPRPISSMVSSMAEVRAAQIAADRFMPWRNTQPRWQTGYALHVDTDLFLVPEFLVRNSTAIQLRRAGSSRHIAAEIVHADPRFGLALIRPTQESWFQEARALTPLTEIPRQGELSIVQWGPNDHLQVGIGNLLSVAYQNVGSGIPAQLSYELASSLRINHAGTPVIQNGHLAGIVMQTGGNRRGATILAPDVIARFLEANTKEVYTGIPEPDFRFMRLGDPVRRKFLGVPDELEDRGILIRAVHNVPGQQHGLLPGDVLLAWDGHDLDARGNYEHQSYGRIPFRHLASLRSPGDIIEASVIRNRETQSVQVVMRPASEIFESIPENETGLPDDYVVSGGLVFRELTIDYLRAFGDQWQRQAEIDLVWHAFVMAEDTPEEPAQTRTVILVGVLSDPVNIGYRDLRHQIVSRINGHPIKNLADLSARIDQEGLLSVTFQNMEAVPITFNPEEVDTANQRIQERFQIPALRRISSTSSP
jgi:hypothetical protein